jgi:hypothetical protein
MNLHGQIMNIKCDPCNVSAGFDAGALTSDQVTHYKLGHKDARHAAAELALKADAINAELLAALQDLIEAADSMRATFGCIRGDTPEDSDTFIHDEWAEGFLQERADAARAAIAAATGEQA